MGIDFAQTRFLDACARSAPITGPMLALGSLTLRESDASIVEFGNQHGYRQLVKDKSVRALMCERYGITDYVSCDINGLADIELDLSIPLPKHQRGRYGSLLNGGTLEHIFDVRQAMENIHDAVRVGGVMIHTTPLTWFDHGFYNFNPVFFHQTANSNRYKIVTEGFYYCAGTFPGQNIPFVSLNDVDERVPHVDKPTKELFGGTSLPALVMHLICLQKTSNAPFAIPVQEAH